MYQLTFQLTCYINKYSNLHELDKKKKINLLSSSSPVAGAGVGLLVAPGVVEGVVVDGVVVFSGEKDGDTCTEK